MSIRPFALRAAGALSLLLALLPAAQAQNYPTKPVKIVASESGGPSDVSARLIAAGLSSAMGQQFVVENHGGLGTLPGDAVYKTAPDGYTLLVYTGNMWISPILAQKSNYDPIKDFAPVMLISRVPNVLVVNASSPVNSTQDLIALAKSKPGELNWGSGPIGSSPYLAGMMFKLMAGLDMQHVPYKGSAPGIVDLVAGRIHLFFPSAASIAPQIKSGRVKALAITSASRSALMPDLPPVGAAVPGFNSVSVLNMWAPAKTPAPIITRLNQELVKVLNVPDVKAKFLALGSEIVASTPAQLAEAQKADMEATLKMVKDAKLGPIELE